MAVRNARTTQVKYMMFGGIESMSGVLFVGFVPKFCGDLVVAQLR